MSSTTTRHRAREELGRRAVQARRHPEAGQHHDHRTGADVDADRQRRHARPPCARVACPRARRAHRRRCRRPRRRARVRVVAPSCARGSRYPRADQPHRHRPTPETNAPRCRRRGRRSTPTARRSTHRGNPSTATATTRSRPVSCESPHIRFAVSGATRNDTPDASRMAPAVTASASIRRCITARSWPEIPFYDSGFWADDQLNGRRTHVRGVHRRVTRLRGRAPPVPSANARRPANVPALERHCRVGARGLRFGGEARPNVDDDHDVAAVRRPGRSSGRS